ncbi:MAG: formyltransferase family protein [Planctomycetaceae bacterium]
MDRSMTNRPRVVLLTMPGLFGAEIINRLAAEPGIELVGVGLSSRVYKNKGTLATALTLWKRTGWRYLAYNALVADVAWTALRIRRRPSGLANVRGQVRSLADINAPPTLDWLRSLEPDYVASLFFNQWIGPGVCSIPQKACLNLHPSPLPALRGPDPIFRTLERGLTSTALTIHEVADEFDAGRILHQEPRAVPAGATAFGLYLELLRDGADLLARWLAGNVVAAVPDAAPANSGDYTTFPTPAEVRAFLRSGRRLVSYAQWRRALAAVQ